MKVLAADEELGLLAVTKEPGVLSHPNRKEGDSRALLPCAWDEAQECYHWTEAQGTPRRLWLLHRLDSATSGVLLLATREEAAARARLAFAQRRVNKTYRAIVFGAPPADGEEWRDRLAVEEHGGVKRARGGVPPGKAALSAETSMRLLERTPTALGLLSALELRPHTGRMHQLRVQCAKRGLPIVGDSTYGDFRRNRQVAATTGSERLFLHAWKLRLEALPGDGARPRIFEALAPLPAEFAALLRRPR